MESAPVFGREELDAFFTLERKVLLKLAEKQGIDTRKHKTKRQLLVALAQLRGRPGPGQSNRPTYLAFYVPDKPQQSSEPAAPEAGPSSLRATPSRPVMRSSAKQPPPPSVPSPSRIRARIRARTRDTAPPPTSSAAPARSRPVPLGALREDSIQSWSAVDAATDRDGRPTPADESCNVKPRSSQRQKLSRTASRRAATSSVPPIQELPKVFEESATRGPSHPPCQPVASAAVPAGRASVHPAPPPAISSGVLGRVTHAGTRQLTRRSESERGQDDHTRRIDEKRLPLPRRVREEMLQPDLEFLVPLVQLCLAKCYRRYQDAGLQFKIPTQDLIAPHLRNLWVGGAPEHIKRDLQMQEHQRPLMPPPRPPTARASHIPPHSTVQEVPIGNVRVHASTGRAHESGEDEAAASEAGSNGSTRKRRRERDEPEGDTASTGSAEKRRRYAMAAVPKIDKGKRRAYD